jgi:hypothetical protein
MRQPMPQKVVGSRRSANKRDPFFYNKKSPDAIDSSTDKYGYTATGRPRKETNASDIKSYKSKRIQNSEK